ncbi:hypothetical protein [Helicobacter pullorum]|uniref:hypothetical protein n=1 Tax=Helicobacter pullorum TaxID=35818 RepID=UPI0013159EBA|nr:hypothetical protein [Helicobacter pullorum]
MKNLAEEIVHFLYNAKLPIEDRNFINTTTSKIVIFVAIIVSQLRLLLNFWNLLGVRHIKLYVMLNCHIRLPFLSILSILMNTPNIIYQ